MHFGDLLSPLKRYKYIWILTFVALSAAIYTGLSQIPKIEKTTIYFSLAPIAAENSAINSMDPAESTMKTAEAIAGWAQNPRFREDVLKDAEIFIPNFKRKISARKQNYLNVFWTIKLYGDENQHRNKITEATIKNINERFEALTKDSTFPFKMTKPEVFSLDASIPNSWSLSFSIFAGFCLSLFAIYLIESIRGRVSFYYQIRKVFPDAPLLHITDKPGAHDEKLLERFILTFESPRLIGTFPAAEKFFSLSPSDNIDGTVDTPILLIKMGSTTTLELENLKAIFGDQCGLILFNK